MKCKWPLNHISISSTGVYRPCCAWQESNDQPSVLENSLEQYLDSNFYKEMIADFKDNKFAKGCTECIRDEQAGVKGMLQYGNNKYINNKEFSIHDMEIKFGNICNAGCVMCSAYNSSLIEQENKNNKSLISYRRDFTSPVKNWFDDPNKFKEVAILASKCERIRFTGGEPTVRGLLTDFLTIVQKHNTDVAVQITSNGSSFGKRLQDCLQQFRRVEINVSIDGYGTANDFIRWPIKWSKLEANVEKMLSYDNIIVDAKTSLQAASLDSLQNLIEWCKDRNIQWHASGVYSPQYLQPFLAKQHILDKVKHINDARVNKLINYNSAKEEKDQLRKQLISYFDTLSNIRNINWKECLDV